MAIVIICVVSTWFNELLTDTQFQDVATEEEGLVASKSTLYKFTERVRETSTESHGFYINCAWVCKPKSTATISKYFFILLLPIFIG